MSLTEAEEMLVRDAEYFGEHDEQSRDLAALVRKLQGRVEGLEASIRMHAECFTVCERCGHEMSNATDDVCRALARPGDGGGRGV